MSRLSSLLTQFNTGGLSRRGFMHGATALGMSAAGAAWLANGGNPAAAQTDTATPDTGGFEAPAYDTEGLERGAHGELRILW